MLHGRAGTRGLPPYHPRFSLRSDITGGIFLPDSAQRRLAPPGHRVRPGLPSNVARPWLPRQRVAAGAMQADSLIGVVFRVVVQDYRASASPACENRDS